jgi:hypothetical protein
VRLLIEGVVVVCSIVERLGIDLMDSPNWSVRVGGEFSFTDANSFLLNAQV